MIATAISALAGNLFVHYWSFLPPIFFYKVAIVIVILSLLKRDYIPFIFLLSLAWTHYHAQQQLNQQLAQNLINKEITIQGKIIELPHHKPHALSFEFKLIPQNIALPSQIYLTWYSPSQIPKIGEIWQFSIKLKPVHGLFNQNGFDAETFAFIRHRGATGYIRHQQAILLKLANINSIDYWRQQIADRLQQLTENGVDQSMIGILKALSIGDGSAISQSQWTVFRRSGTIHLIVISGSHISLVAGFIFMLCRYLWIKGGNLRFASDQIAALIALIMAIFYSALAGFSIPTQRALIMITIAMLAIILRRHQSSIKVLSLALIIILIYDPLSVLSSGFWLSFISVYWLLYLGSGRLSSVEESVILLDNTQNKGLFRLQTQLKKVAQYIIEFAHFNIAINIGLMPLLFWYFQQTSLIAPIANLIAIPVIELIVVPLLLFSVIGLWLFKPLAIFLLKIVSEILQFLYVYLHYLSEIKRWVIWELASPNLLALLLAIIASFWLYAPRGFPAKWLSFCLWLPLFLPKTDKLARGEFEMTLLDVGQGLSIVIQTTDHVLIFDTGAKYSTDFDMGNAVVLPFLRQQNIQSIDRLIISHGDNDHSGGTKSLLAELPVLSIYTSVPQLFPNSSAIFCQSGQHWFWDQVHFEMLSPLKSTGSENNQSCVLKITGIYHSLLLTGDIESEAENDLVDRYQTQLHSDILISPHHGSKTSSSFTFLTTVQPQIVLISAGYYNRYHLPNSAILKRYQELHLSVLNTASSGAISVKSIQNSIQVIRYRQSYRHYWHQAFN